MLVRNFYNYVVLRYPLVVLASIILMITFLGYQAQNLQIDASSETLVMEGDKDLAYTREVNKRYGNQDFLFITFTPKNELLSNQTLDAVKRLRNDLEKLIFVDSVFCILNVPLLESPPQPVSELVKNVPTLESPNIDKRLARKEFLNSPIYQKMLVSPDFKTTAFQVNLIEDKKWIDFVNQRNHLRSKEKDGSIRESEKLALKKIISDFKIHRDENRAEVHKNIAEVRALIEKYRDEGELFLGGVSMIGDDLITFLKNDLSFFGTGVLIFLIIMLLFIFRQIRWIIIPVVTCTFSVIATAGLLGMFGWEVTVISSNFISIQIIITMAVTIHLIVRYRELMRLNPEADQKELILDTVSSMWKPCSYAILTTIAGFSSLILCDMLPVINFGWMMSAGISVSLILTFLIFPSILMLMKKLPASASSESHFTLTKKLATFTEKKGMLITWLSALVLLLSIMGGSKLMVENSFIDYFKKSTEIYQGMKVIDQKLGGTTPLDVIVDLPMEEDAVIDNSETDDFAENIEDFDESDEFEDIDDDLSTLDEIDEVDDANAAAYWFTSEKMNTVERIHDYLDDIPETGKVMSLGTLLKIGRVINEGEPLDNFMLALIYKELPEEYRKIILSPYVSVENSQVRFSIRIRDSEPDLRRNELLQRIRREMTEKLALKAETVHFTSLLVLYNNMLQSLFNSQIMTLGAVVVALMVMFLILFRSIKVAIIAIFPNILSVGVVLGFMGWAKIPLDMMTITIASISVGIAVDDTIHYIHRFIKEYQKDHNYIATMHRCHESIGYAMYYTSITIIIGFSILVTSNFIPTIYFGLLTGLAMIIALIAALTLLPQLIILIKPFGPDINIKTS
jgi:uncharacterized protein